MVAPGEDAKLIAEVSFSTDPLETPPVWEQIEIDAVSAEIGRDDELDEFAPGRASLTVDNQDREFDPFNPDGDHYGDLLPGKRMRLTATHTPDAAALLAEAVVLLRASSVPSDYADTDTWVNEGAGGSALDATVAGQSSAPTFVHPDDGLPLVRYFSGNTNEDAADPSLMETPDTAGLSITGDLMIRARVRGAGDVYSGGAIDQAVYVRKIPGTDTADYLVTNYSINVTSDGDVRVTWLESDDDNRSLDVGDGSLDPWGFNEIMVRLDVDNGASGRTAMSYVRDDDAGSPDFTIAHDGSKWALLGTATEAGVTDIKDTDGPLTFMIGKGFGFGCRVYDSIDAAATPVLDLDIERDAEPGDTEFECATGQTWTVRGASRIVEVDRPAFFHAIGNNPSQFLIDDNDLLDFDGTASATVVALVTPLVADGAFERAVTKVTGIPGVDGQGYVLGTIESLGGTIALVVDSDPSVAFSSTADTDDRQLLALTLNRDTDEIRLFVDGTGAPAADASAIGSIANTADLAIGPSNTVGMIIEAVAVWRRALTDVEIDAATAALVGNEISYSVFEGFVDGWPVTEADLFAQQIGSSDGLARLGHHELGESPLESVIESLNPLRWYKLDDGEDATECVDYGSELVPGAYRGSVSVDDQTWPNLDAGGLDDGSSASSVEMRGLDDGYVDISRAPDGWTWGMVLVSCDDVSQTVFSLGSLWLQVRGDGTLRFGHTQRHATGATNVADSGRHLIVFDLEADSIIVDGVDDTSSSDDGNEVVSLGRPTPPNVIGFCARDDQAPGYWDGRIAHLAFFDSDISAAAPALWAAAQGWVNDTTGQRVNRLLDLAAWPSSDRDIDTGTVTLGTAVELESNVLDELRSAEASEGGQLYQKPDGIIRFRRRHALLTDPRSTMSRYLFTDDPTVTAGYRYSNPIIPNQGDRIRNSVSVTWSGGTVVAEDAASIAAHGRRSHPITTGLRTAAQARSLAEWILIHYSQPVFRITGITLDMGAEPSTWRPALDLTIGDRVQVRWQPQSVGAAITSDVLVEGKKLAASAGVANAHCELTLSAVADREFWILGTSQLGVDTIAA